MDTSNWINFLLLIVSIIAAVIAWRGTFAARSAAREANKTQKRLLAIEEERERDRKASLRSAKFDVSHEAYNSGLEIESITFYNSGDADAYDVEFRLNGESLKGNGSDGSVNRVKILKLGASITLRGFSGPMYGSNNVMIVWKDELGQTKTQNELIHIR